MYSAYKLNKQGDNIQPWHTPFPIWNQSVAPCLVLTAASWPSYKFLRRQVRWSHISISLRISHSLLWSTQRLWHSQWAEVDVFLEFSCFFYDPTDVGNFDLWFLWDLNSAWTSGSSQFTYCRSLAWRILSITFLACEMSAIVWVWTFFALPFFGIGMKTDLFHSYGHCWVFQICWHIECSTFTAPSFRIWNSSTGIPPSPLALLTVMLPKADLTWHSTWLCLSLLQQIFPTQGSNPGLPHCSWILYQLSHKGRPCYN